MPEMPSLARSALTSAPYRLFARRVLLPWVLQGERPAGEGLEIGAGSGAMAAQLLAAFPGLRLVATDYDPAMVNVARRNLARFGSRAVAGRADAAALPFHDDRFDLVLSVAMLHHVISWEQALAEAVRVLRPGGRLVGYDVLDTAPVRLLHLGQGQQTRLMRRDQMAEEFGRLPLAEVRARPAAGGALVRFTATKAGQGRR